MSLLVACSPQQPASVAALDKPPACGQLTKARFDEPGLPARDYYVYASCKAKKAPLVVYLHGCNQNAEEAFVQTRWKSFADAHGLVLAFPTQFKPDGSDLNGQLFDGNGAQCWNWFRPEDVMRGSGEPATLAGITARVTNQYDVDPLRVYVMGISAGGAMTAVMGATYPELYAALAIDAGVTYPLGTDPSGAAAWQAMGDNAHAMPVIVIQGTADEAVPFAVGGIEVTQQWLGTNDLIDDGAPNGSVPRAPDSSEDHGVDDTVVGGLGTVGDTCVGDRTASPCLGGVLGWGEYPYTVEHYLDAAGAPLVDLWILHGAMHNYVSGDPSVNWSDPLGPDITQAAYDFFMAHPGRKP